MTSPEVRQVHPDRMTSTERLRLRLLRAEDAAPLREVTSSPGWVETLAARPGYRE
jgi:hypothetical protein